MLAFLKTDSRDQISKHFPKIKLIISAVRRKAIAKKAQRELSLTLNSATVTLLNLLSGRLKVSVRWEDFLLDELGCKDKASCFDRYPSLIFSSDSKKTFERFLRYTDRLQMQRALSLMVQGKISVSREWEFVMLQTFGFKSRRDLMRLYPLMRFDTDL